MTADRGADEDAAGTDSVAADAPAEPSTRIVTIPGRGTTSVLECPGPPGAPVLVLLHGVTMNAELGWRQVIRPLSRHFRVIAPDMRGHGDGVGIDGRFSLEDCADDVAALASVLGVDRFVAAGYSMGGTVAQLLWRQHPDRVASLVLCATGPSFVGSPVERAMSMSMPAVLGWSAMTAGMTAEVLGASVLGPIGDSRTRGWARAQMGRTTLSAALAAMHAVSEFSSHEWVGSVDVPTALIVTTRDSLVPVRRQLRLAEEIQGARVLELDGDHGACVSHPEVFGRLLLDACHWVSARTEAQSRPIARATLGGASPLTVL